MILIQSKKYFQNITWKFFVIGRVLKTQKKTVKIVENSNFQICRFQFFVCFEFKHQSKSFIGWFDNYGSE